MLMQWMELLNSANVDFSTASDTTQKLSDLHSIRAEEFIKWQEDVLNMELTCASRYLLQAKPYFDLQMDLWVKLEQHGKIIMKTENSLSEAKNQLAESVKSITDLANQEITENSTESEDSGKCSSKVRSLSPSNLSSLSSDRCISSVISEGSTTSSRKFRMSSLTSKTENSTISSDSESNGSCEGHGLQDNNSSISKSSSDEDSELVKITVST